VESDVVVSLPAYDNVSAFAAEVFRSMSRADQRRWAEVYLRGLLLADGKKSVRRIAESVPIFHANQSLQQFINQSPWDWEPVRALIAQRIEHAKHPRAWVVERVVIPKRGERSVGVQRRFVPEMGRTVNSQLALGIALASESASVPVNWRISLSGRWGKDPELRGATYIPEPVAGKPEWVEVAEMVEEMALRWKLSPVPVVGDVRHFSDVTRLLTRMANRGVGFSVQVDGSFPVMGTDYLTSVPNPDAAPQLVDPQAVVTIQRHLRGLGKQLPKDSVRTLTGTGSRRAGLVSSLARIPPLRGDGNPSPKVVRIIGELSPKEGFARYWITNLTHHRLDEVMSLTRLAQRSRVEMQTLASEFGLRDFEGRSYPGWHHHMTMVSAAFAYSVVGWEGAMDAAMSS